MKKIVLTLALAAFAFAANAQLVIGGSCGFNAYNGGHEWDQVVRGTTSTEYTLPNDRSNSFTFAPKVGFNLNDDMQVGITIAYNHSSNTNYSNWATEYQTYKDFQGWSRHNRSSCSIEPYFRYSFLHMNKLTAFVEATVSFGFGLKDKYRDFNTAVADYYATGIDLKAHDTTYVGNTNSTTFGIGIVPGLNYKLTDHISLDLYIDLLSLTFVSTTTHYLYEDASINYKHESKNVDNDFHFGLNLNPQTLQSHLSYFRLGFNYVF